MVYKYNATITKKVDIESIIDVSLAYIGETLDSVYVVFNLGGNVGLNSKVVDQALVYFEDEEVTKETIENKIKNDEVLLVEMDSRYDYYEEEIIHCIGQQAGYLKDLQDKDCAEFIKNEMLKIASEIK